MNTDTTTSTGVTAVVAPPIDTEAELRRQHSALLQRDVAGAGTSKPTPGELLGFLESASKLGRSLEDGDARETSQNIMDFWIAQLLSQAPQAAEGSRPFSLEPFDERSAKLVLDDAQQLRVQATEAASSANDICKLQSEKVSVSKLKIARLFELMPDWTKPLMLRVAGGESKYGMIRRLLLRFVRLKEKSLEAYSVPLASDDDILGEPKTKELLDQLIQAGVVRPQAMAGDGKGSYVLTHDSLIKEWSFLREIVAQRKAFRELTSGWENGGRPRAVLLAGGSQLQQALDYPHLDDSEKAFVEASRHAGETNRRIALGLVTVAVIVLATMLYRVNVANRGLRDAIKDRDKAIENQDAAIIDLKRAIKDREAATDYIKKQWVEGEKQKAELEAERKTVSKNNAELTAKSEELAQQLAIAFTLKSQLKSLRDQLNGRPDISESIKTQLKLAAAEESVLPPRNTKGMVEIFVSTRVDSAARAAMPFADAISKAGFWINGGVALPRSSVENITEVRYFYEDDEGLANEVVTVLKNAKFSAPIQMKYNEDNTAPKRFIQISVARAALKPQH